MPTQWAVHLREKKVNMTLDAIEKLITDGLSPGYKNLVHLGKFSIFNLGVGKPFKERQETQKLQQHPNPINEAGKLVTNRTGI